MSGLLGDTGRAGGGRGMSYTQHRKGGRRGGQFSVGEVGRAGRLRPVGAEFKG